MTRVPDERPLSSEETRLLEWLLAHGMPDAPDYRWQIAKLRVVGRCGCGCPTVDFAIGANHKKGASHIIADLEGTSPEGIGVGVILHVREGEISELEVYSRGGEDCEFSLPRPESLLPYVADQ